MLVHLRVFRGVEVQRHRSEQIGIDDDLLSYVILCMQLFEDGDDQQEIKESPLIIDQTNNEKI